MQSMLHLTAFHGIPLCISTKAFSLSKEMEDHERRRRRRKSKGSRAGLNMTLWRDMNDEIMAYQYHYQAIMEAEPLPEAEAEAEANLLYRHYASASTVPPQKAA